MNSRAGKITAPIVVLIIILVAWESLVLVLGIQKFLLPRPSVIVSNLVRVVVVTPEDLSVEDKVIEDQLKAEELIIYIPRNSPQALLDKHIPGTFFGLPLGGTVVYVTEGRNLSAIIQASVFTLRGALGGMLIGCVAGVLVAIITARWTATRESLMPFAIAVNSMPIIAFAPIMNNWFGIDKALSKMAIVAIMVFFPMMINTVKGLTLVDNRSLELMRSYAASEFSILFKLRMPNALPYIFTGLKVAAALSMIGAIVGEYFGGPRIALGVFITQEAALFRFGSAWAAIILACAIGITLYLIIVVLERVIMPWHVSFR